MQINHRVRLLRNRFMKIVSQVTLRRLQLKLWAGLPAKPLKDKKDFWAHSQIHIHLQSTWQRKLSLNFVVICPVQSQDLQLLSAPSETPALVGSIPSQLLVSLFWHLLMVKSTWPVSATTSSTMWSQLITPLMPSFWQHLMPHQILLFLVFSTQVLQYLKWSQSVTSILNWWKMFLSIDLNNSKVLLGVILSITEISTIL